MLPIRDGYPQDSRGHRVRAGIGQPQSCSCTPDHYHVVAVHAYKLQTQSSTFDCAVQYPVLGTHTVSNTSSVTPEELW